MVATSIALMRWSDIPGACRLSQSEGWNQTPADWSRFLHYQPDGCWVARHGEQVVGTITTTCYEDRLAWIGMMLVDSSYRRQGIAQGLMETALAFLQDRSIPAVQLDATPAGQPLYEKLGFVSQWSFHRWQREPSSDDLHPLKSVNPNWLDQVRDLDSAAFGVNRNEWLTLLSADAEVYASSEGFGMLRAGQQADYLGPITAQDFDSAQHIVSTLLGSTNRRLYWDVPQRTHRATVIAKEFGFQSCRDLQRMYYGVPIRSRIENQFAICDPAVG